ncbi:MAG: NAD(P)/FAD-dependent oxidoreductase [Lachnospiraceae bacterium]|jgi:uncharacterized FAD-dependent dehydrogenase
MKIRISGIRIPCGKYSEKTLGEEIRRILRLPKEAGFSWTLVRQSVDARKKPELFYVCAADADLPDREAKKLLGRKSPQLMVSPDETYRFPEPGKETLPGRPVIMGFGPAGMFCALELAKHGYRPVVIERGAPVDERERDVEAFWSGGELNPESNVSFGEGGAGTFSDGKLNTGVKDTFHRGREVLRTFVEHGAPESILVLQKPHIGTDVLKTVVKNIREEIIRQGGEVLFHHRLIGLEIRGGKLEAVTVQTPGGIRQVPCGILVLAAGHSARDTFSLLADLLPMTSKPFAVGVRIEHPQAMINLSQYGSEYPENMAPADYKLTFRSSSGRGVYSFCMCPGGYVVNASTEPGRLVTNGMSYHARDSRNANSALIVTVGPEDFAGTTPRERYGQELPADPGRREILAGMEFQRRLEEAAFRAAAGRVPVQLYGDFAAGRLSESLGGVEPCIRGRYGFGDLNRVLPDGVSAALKEAVPYFGRKIRGFDRPDAVLSGVESRTSSPVRILRDESGESPVRGIYPCGEGAGYAGGITSAAMDGCAAAERIAEKYAPYSGS